MKQIVYLIRHGHTAGTESDLMYGDTELPVTHDGLREVADFAARGIYPDPEGAAVYTSGMIRALQTLAVMYGADPDGVYIRTEDVYPPRMGSIERTAEEIGSLCTVPHMKEPLLREINVGPYEMMTIREILEDDYGRKWLEGRVDDPTFEGGDSMSGFRRRALKGIRRITEDAAARGIERIIAVIHGGVIASILQAFYPDTYEDIWDWTPAPGTGYAVTFVDGKPVSWEMVGDTGYRAIPKG